MARQQQQCPATERNNMSIFSEAMGNAADITNMQSGGQSFLDDVGNALTMGAAGAVISGYASIYNTAAAGINALGGSVEEMSTVNKLQEIDNKWADYYTANKNAIDVVGFIGSSFIPGGLAIKGLNLARAGATTGAFGRALNFARTRQAASLDAALVELAAEGGTVFTRINKNKAAAMAWGAADQVIVSAAFETGVALTMNQSPLLADDSWWDIGKTALVGAAFGGIIGGGVDSLILNKSFRNAVKALDSKERNYDYVQHLDRLNLDTGDKAFAIVDSLTRLPKDVNVDDAVLNLSFHLAGGTVKREVNINKLLTTKLSSTNKSALLDFETTIRSLAPDATAATPFAEFALRRFDTMRKAGATDEAIRESLGDLLFELKSVRAATSDPLVASKDLWYFKKALTADELSKIDSITDWETAIKSSTPFADNAYKKPYVFLGTNEQRLASFQSAARIGGDAENAFPTLTAAWKAGKDVAFMSDGTLRVNDASSLWKRVDDDVYGSSRYINMRTGAVTGDTVLTAADRLLPGKALGEAALKKDAVYLETKTGSKTISMKVFTPDGDTEYFTARHAWASNLADKDLPDLVDATDFSLMDRLRTASTGRLEEIDVYAGKKPLGSADNISLVDTIKSNKLAKAQELFMDAHEAGISLDVRAVAYQLNVDAQWLENAVATRFRESMAGDLRIGSKSIDSQQGVNLPLESYRQRENLITEFARPQQFRELDAITPGMSWRAKRKLIQDSVAASGGQFVTGELAWGQRVRDAIQVTRTAAMAASKPGRMELLMDISQDAARQVDSTGTGSSLFGSSNAGYGDGLKLWSQDTGKHLHKWIQEDDDEIVDALGSGFLKLINSPEAAAELGIITNLGRSTDAKYVWNPANPKQMMLRELRDIDQASLKFSDAVSSAKGNGQRVFIDVESDIVADLLKTHSTLSGERVGKRTVLNNARGFTSNIDAGTIYFPPIDTTYFQHFVFVRPIQGKAFGTSEVSMIFGRDAAELSKRISSVDTQNFEVIPKGNTEKYFKAKDAYDFDLTINEPRINSELRKSGALNNFQPEVRAENLIEDYLRWHQNQSGRLARDTVETYYAQQFAEIRKLGEAYVDLASSQFAGTLKKTKTEIINPIDDYLKGALDISKRSEYTFLHEANEFVDALGTRAYRAVQDVFGDASKGIVTWEQANTQMEKFGIKGVYSRQEEFFTANIPRDRSIVKEYVSKANALLANTVLRLDFFNPVVNTISTPLMLGTELASIRTLLKNEPELLGRLGEALSVAVPGGNGARVPSTTKLIAEALANFWGPRKQELLTRYMANGDVKDLLGQMHSMIDNLAMRADFKLFSDGVNKAFETGARFTLNEQTEQMTRFITADVMRMLTEPAVEAGKLSLKEQNAFISVFVNRVQGNYISSQRPIVFQGVLGSAVSLFQTYSFNLMQQLLRHVENRDKRAIATLFGMQAGTFGLNGTPFFEAVNTHIIGNASTNKEHYDAYSVAPGILGKELGDWLMYGTASAMPAFATNLFGSDAGKNWPALYTRGDINPRHMSILPLHPADIPAIDSSIRVVGNLLNVGKKLLKGADMSETLLQGLEHNGISRPLAGFAQVLNSKSTTSRGGLISASSDFSMITTGARILGAKPMEEAVALNAMYRVKSYQTADQERMEFLGEKVKSFLYRNEFPDDDTVDTFMLDYAKAGGRVENFNSALQRWSRDANRSTVEKMRGKLNTTYGRRLSEIMGGEPLDDYWNQPQEQAVPPQE